MDVSPLDLLWIGTKGEMEERLIPQFDVPLATIQGGAVVGVSPWKAAKNMARLAWSAMPAFQLINRFKPTVALFTGGYVNAPVALVNWLKRVPTCIYLPDVEPGTTIRRLLPFAQKIAVTTDESARFLPAAKMAVTGYPVRPEIRNALQLSKQEALAIFDLAEGRQTLFVFGGSRGAQSVNRALMAILPTLLKRVQVIHISGTLTWEETAKNAESLPPDQRRYYRPYPYLDKEMGAAFRAADLAVARAGASMLGESPAFGLPAILIPYPYAWRYQKVNADYLANRGAAIRLDDEKMSAELLPAILNILDDPNRLSHMRQAAKRLDQPHAAKKLAQLLIDMEKNSAA